MIVRLVAVMLMLSVPCVVLSADLPSASAADVFRLSKILPVHLTVTPKAYAEMNPPPNLNPFGPPGGAGGRPAINPADTGAGNFGFEFTYVHADAEIEGVKFTDIGLRYKGSGTYLSSGQSAKRSFKIDFDKYRDKQNFRGFTKLNLNSGVMDATKIREPLAYSVFRAAGVPVCKTAFAEVTLTVPGKYDREYLGLYAVIEQVDKAFLATHFKNAKGLLLKPEGIRGIPYLGEDPAAYAKPFNVKAEDEGDGLKRLIAFAKLINKADEAQFRAQIGSYLDMDAFTRFLAASAILASYDGFIGMGHNYYLYLNPDTNKFTFIPWDLDLAFGGFFLFGPPEQQIDFSIDRPFQGENILIERLLTMPDVKAAYRKHLKQLAEGVLASASFAKDIELLQTLAKEPLAKEKQAATARREGQGGFGMPGMGMGMGGPVMPLKTWAEKRAASVTAQLAGQKEGIVPAMPTFGPPGGFGPGNQLAKPLLDSLDTDKNGKVSEAEFQSGMLRLFKEWDKDGSGALDQKKIADGLQKLLPPPAGAPNRK